MVLTDYLRGIADAIREKDGTDEPINAQDFASRILGIQTGGIELSSNMRMGTFTLAEDSTSKITIEHGLGEIPFGVFVMIDEMVSRIPFSSAGGFYFGGTTNAIAINNAGSYALVYSNPIVNMTEESFELVPRADTYPFRSGYTYRWIVWGGADNAILQEDER